MAELFTLDNGVAFLALASLEIVLGIDNVVFISILAERLPESQQARARQIGLLLAMVMRILLLFVIGWVMRLEAELFAVFGEAISGKDLVLILGGLFLIYKATKEIHEKLETDEEETLHGKAAATMTGVLIQVMLLDVVFSLDSVITAVGMVDAVPVMVVAIIVAVVVMMVFAGPISRFIKRHPTTKMLALAFLLLIGFTLLLEGVGTHVNKAYIYVAMAFALAVEVLNLLAGKARAKRKTKVQIEMPGK